MKIHQILPTLSSKDAIGNHTLEIQRILQRWGHESLIFADDIHEDMRPFAKSYKKLKGRTLVIFSQQLLCQQCMPKF